ncbi:hypothetical protein NXS98_13245 [Fontisphaera persica]|uniref:hypothetical protein n=1 Tax=Fontisphaera persica TaxID=2974023 RepID=UPI0024BF435A|nr:hypothetical protein [Fontisphaera persica]WCJ58676.1 hypothetical protein NXS98_13245 [Fontisphaera persica]
MLTVKLSTLAVILGLAVLAPNLYGLWQPARFAAVARQFPRHWLTGVVLMLVSTAWFIYYVRWEEVADFEPLKPYLYGLFIAVGIGSCLFVRDFLAVRGAAVFMLLLAKLMVDTARWAESDWRLVIVVWAYVLVVAGIWLTVSPWRLRDWLQWATATEQRVRVGSALRAAFGLLVLLLGLFVF